MPNLIVYEEREVKAKGLDPKNKVNEEKLKEYFFDEDYAQLKQLEKISKINLSFDNPTLIYPGCGVDLFSPLIYLERLFPEVKAANLIFIDENEALSVLKTQLDEVGVSFAEKKNRITFYWKDQLIALEFIEGDIAEILSKLPNYHLYFEKAFRIMREQIPDYERRILEKLSVGGIVISDTGFEDADLEQFNVPKELSAYGEMIIGKKK
ncbi:MAG: hypothetical protein WCV90_05955 [Candidatus Woesearchaeota archaeon]